MTFNRHADISGTPNRVGQPCSLASSGGIYAEAWVARNNSVKLVALAVSSGAAYSLTDDGRFRVMFDR